MGFRKHSTGVGERAQQGPETIRGEIDRIASLTDDRLRYVFRVKGRNETFVLEHSTLGGFGTPWDTLAAAALTKEGDQVLFICEDTRVSSFKNLAFEG